MFTPRNARTIVPLLILAVIMVAIPLACRKADVDSSDRPAKFDVAAAKEWWYGSFRKSSAYAELDFTSPFTPVEILNSTTRPKTKSIKFPIWSKAADYAVGSQTLIEVPLRYFAAKMLLPNKDKLSHPDLLRVMDATRSTLVFKQNGSKTDISIRVITYIPDIKYLKEHGSDFHKVSLFRNSDFTGWMVIRKWNEKLLRLYRVERGAIKTNYRVCNPDEKRKILKKGKSGEIEMYSLVVPTPSFGQMIASTGMFECSDYYETSGDEPMADDCKTWIKVGDQNDIPEIIVPDEIETGSECNSMGGLTEYCACQLFSLGCSSGGGGSGGGLYDDALEVDLEDPCINAVFNQLNGTSTKIRSSMLNFVTQFFTNYEAVNLRIQDGWTFTDPNVYGEWRPHNNLPLYYFIYLDPKLSNTSKEFRALVLLHEIYHGYFYIKGFDVSSNYNHSLFPMLRSHLASQLRSYFPSLSQTDADALTWFGLHESIPYINKSGAEKAAIDSIVSRYRLPNNSVKSGDWGCN